MTTKGVGQLFLLVSLLNFDMACTRRAENTVSRFDEHEDIPVREKFHSPTAMMYESTSRMLDAILVARQLE